MGAFSFVFISTSALGFPAYSGKIGRLFGLKTAGCSGKSATLLVAPD